MERKFGTHSELKNVKKKKYAQSFLETADFNGYITLVEIEQVTEPLIKECGKHEICVIDEGYMVLQHFPLNENHSVTTMFNSKGEIVQWYIDIILENGLENDIPWMDDLYLDIVALPSGEVIRLDADELEEALRSGKITKQQFDLAWNEADKVYDSITKDNFPLIKLSAAHKQLLEGELSE
jgi:predicted RNA-binding protein associated with RNAse of E/G family